MPAIFFPLFPFVCLCWQTEDLSILGTFSWTTIFLLHPSLHLGRDRSATFPVLLVLLLFDVIIPWHWLGGGKIVSPRIQISMQSEDSIMPLIPGHLNQDFGAAFHISNKARFFSPFIFSMLCYTSLLQTSLVEKTWCMEGFQNFQSLDNNSNITINTVKHFKKILFNCERNSFRLKGDWLHKQYGCGIFNWVSFSPSISSGFSLPQNSFPTHPPKKISGMWLRKSEYSRNIHKYF